MWAPGRCDTPWHIPTTISTLIVHPGQAPPIEQHDCHPDRLWLEENNKGSAPHPTPGIIALEVSFCIIGVIRRCWAALRGVVYASQQPRAPPSSLSICPAMTPHFLEKSSAASSTAPPQSGGPGEDATRDVWSDTVLLLICR